MCILGCLTTSLTSMGFPGGGSDKEHAYQCRRHREAGSIPGLGRSPGGGHGNPLQYSCLENSTDRGAWGLQSIALQRVRHNWNNLEGMHTGLYQPDAASIRPLPKVVTPTNVSRHCRMPWGQEWWEMANLPLVENHCSSLPSLLWWFFPLGSEKTPWLSATDVLHPAMCLIIALSKYPKDFNQKYSHLRLRVKSIGTFCWDLEVRTSSSNAEGESLIPDWDLRSHMLPHPPHPSAPAKIKQNIKQKEFCNKFTKDCIKKPSTLKKKE